MSYQSLKLLLWCLSKKLLCDVITYLYAVWFREKILSNLEILLRRKILSYVLIHTEFEFSTPSAVRSVFISIFSTNHQIGCGNIMGIPQRHITFKKTKCPWWKLKHTSFRMDIFFCIKVYLNSLKSRSSCQNTGENLPKRKSMKERNIHMYMKSCLGRIFSCMFLFHSYVTSSAVGKVPQI